MMAEAFVHPYFSNPFSAMKSETMSAAVAVILIQCLRYSGVPKLRVLRARQQVAPKCCLKRS